MTLEAAHFGSTPTTGVNLILTALSSLKMVNGGAGAGGSGCVRTIARYAEVGYDAAAIDLLSRPGLPALLVTCFGGAFKPMSAGGQKFEQTLKFAVLCCAGRFSNVSDRLAGETPTVDPGVEDLLDWATYYGCRGLAGTADDVDGKPVRPFKNVHPTTHRWIRVEPEKFIASVEIEATRYLDYFDDTPTAVLEKLGIVHNPLDYDQLFLVDNTTPNTDAPATVRGGVVTL